MNGQKEKSMKPILFNTEMVRAILVGRKTVTRRVVKGAKPDWVLDHIGDHEAMTKVRADGEEYPVDVPGLWATFDQDGLPEYPMVKAPCQPGDILWVRETWYYESHMEDMTDGEPDLPSGGYSHRYIYKADSPDYPVNVGVGAHGWRPSIHMPREAARLFLMVTGVRVERLQDITPNDCVLEGVEREALATVGGEFARGIFNDVWDSTIKPENLPCYGWEASPWVWVIEFERVSCAENYGGGKNERTEI